MKSTMPFLLLLFFTFTACMPAYSQFRDEDSWSLGVGMGWSRIISSDLLLNHYNYSGTTFSNVNITGIYNNSNHQWHIQLTGNKSQLYPLNENPLYYEYNYIKNTALAFRLSYFYGLTKGQRNFKVYAGLSNAFNYTLQNQFYRSNLYPSGLDLRKSYSISPLNLMPGLLLEYFKGKIKINSTLRYGIVNLAARPNDNYVKQIDVDYARRWQLSFPHQFSSFSYAMLCQYNFQAFGISLHYDLIYDDISGYKSLQNRILTGINLLF